MTITLNVDNRAELTEIAELSKAMCPQYAQEIDDQVKALLEGKSIRECMDSVDIAMEKMGMHISGDLSSGISIHIPVGVMQMMMAARG